MTAPDPAPHDLPRLDLERVVGRARLTHGHLLTAGEARVLARLLDAAPTARALYARLLSRRPAALRVDGLQYAEVTDPAAAVDALARAGLVDRPERTWPLARLLPHLTTVELKAALGRAGLRRSGRKAELVARLVASGGGGARAVPRVALRHRGLLRRLIRLGLHDPRGGLDKLVLDRLGVVRYPDYAPTGGPGLFETRRALVEWERAAARRWALDDPGLVADRERALLAVEAAPQPSPLRHRWSARRHEEAICLAAAALLEKAGDRAAAAETYRRLLAAGLRDAAHARLRLALCLEALGDPAAGAAQCAAALSGPTEALAFDPAARALERTGRRLARKARRGWRPLPPLPKAAERVVHLAPAPSGPRRPRYAVSDRALPVEPALVAWLAAHGRRALHVETALWTTLFALLLRPALFAPVPGMLPTPLLRGPLDLRTPGFRARRAPTLDPILAALRSGGGPARLEAALAAHAGEAITGARWDVVGPDALRAVVADLPGDALAAVLDALAHDWRMTTRGLPDLVVLPGAPARLPETRPARLGRGVLLVEVKGPTDSLSDAQRVWLGRLVEAGVPTELWRVRPLG